MRDGLAYYCDGPVTTLIGNYRFIPQWGMYAAAWTTLVCYATMVAVTCSVRAEIFSRVLYPVKKILAYLTVMLIFFFL